MAQKVFPILLILLLHIRCVSEDNVPSGSQLMLNHNLSLNPDSVFPWTSDGTASLGVSNEVFMTGDRSLFIENPDSLSFNSGSWRQTYSGPMPLAGSSLELTAFVKGENIRYFSYGYIGLSIQIQPWQEHQSITITRDDLILEGDFEWTRIKATLDKFPESADGIRVSLLMPSMTVGKVYFDEITLTVK